MSVKIEAPIVRDTAPKTAPEAIPTPEPTDIAHDLAMLEAGVGAHGESSAPGLGESMVRGTGTVVRVTASYLASGAPDGVKQLGQLIAAGGALVEGDRPPLDELRNSPSKADSDNGREIVSNVPVLGVPAGIGIVVDKVGEGDFSGAGLAMAGIIPGGVTAKLAGKLAPFIGKVAHELGAPALKFFEEHAAGLLSRGAAKQAQELAAEKFSKIGEVLARNERGLGNIAVHNDNGAVAVRAILENPAIKPNDAAQAYQRMAYLFDLIEAKASKSVSAKSLQRSASDIKDALSRHIQNAKDPMAELESFLKEGMSEAVTGGKVPGLTRGTLDALGPTRGRFTFMSAGAHADGLRSLLRGDLLKHAADNGAYVELRELVGVYSSRVLPAAGQYGKNPAVSPFLRELLTRAEKLNSAKGPKAAADFLLEHARAFNQRAAQLEKELESRGRFLPGHKETASQAHLRLHTEYWPSIGS